jgi:hypothetical protein
MLARIRRRLTYANVVATLALFIALGGGSYAAVNLKRGSVKAKHIAPSAVGRSEIARGAVGSPEVANGSLRIRDFETLPVGTRGERGVPGPRGDRGPEGPRGVQGPRGLAGADGLNGATNVVVRISDPREVAPGASAPIHTGCRFNERAIGGGASTVPPEIADLAELAASYPNPNAEGVIPTSWTVVVINKPQNTTNLSFQGYAVCSSP